MGSRWQLWVPRSEGERVCDPVRGVIHNMHRIELPLPRTPTPCYRHLFLTGRGGLTDNGIHLNLPLGLSNEPEPPQRTDTRGSGRCDRRAASAAAVLADGGRGR